MKKIENCGRRWSDMFDWHVAIGCTRCSPACTHCASARWLSTIDDPAINSILEVINDNDDTAKTMNEDHYNWVFNSKIILCPSRLTEPLYLHDGAQVFVAGCSDLFHKDVPFDYIEQVFKIVEAKPKIVFFVITRRPKRAVEFSLFRKNWPENLF